MNQIKVLNEIIEEYHLKAKTNAIHRDFYLDRLKLKRLSVDSRRIAEEKVEVFERVRKKYKERYQVLEDIRETLKELAK